MKKGIPATTAAASFLFAAAAVTFSLIIIKLFINSTESIMELRNKDYAAVIMLFFGIFIFAANGATFLAGAVCLLTGIYSAASGIVIIFALKNNRSKRIHVFCIINLVLSSLTAISFFMSTIRTFVQINSFDFYSAVTIAVFFISVICIILNSLCISLSAGKEKAAG